MAHAPSPIQDSTDTPPPVSRGGRDWLRIALLANLVGQIAIILTGGLVRLTGSGLGCPTWPRCTPDSVVPTASQAEGFHKWIEFGNRLVTFVLVAIALAVLVLAYRAFRQTRPRFVAACTVPLLFVVVQAIVGGIIVLTNLDPKTVSPHFLLSIFLVANAVYLLHRYGEGDGPRELVVPPLLHKLAHLAAAVGGLVIVLGTAVTGSGPHSGDADQPVRFGFDPQATSWLHADAVMLFLGLAVAVVVAAKLVRAPEPFTQAWLMILALSAAQGVLGYLQYFTGRPIVLVAAHLLLSAIFAALLAHGVMKARRRGWLS